MVENSRHLGFAPAPKEQQPRVYNLQYLIACPDRVEQGH